jgi:hypothetical protein
MFKNKAILVKKDFLIFKIGEKVETGGIVKKITILEDNLARLALITTKNQKESFLIEVPNPDMIIYQKLTTNEEETINGLSLS